MEFKKGDWVEVRDFDGQEWHKSKYLIFFDDCGQFQHVVRCIGCGCAIGFKQCRPARPDLQVDHKVWVRDFTYKDWLPYHFAEWPESLEGIKCWENGKTSHSVSDMKNKVHWQHYTLTDPNK